MASGSCRWSEPARYCSATRDPGEPGGGAGTSSACRQCVPKPRGRRFTCPRCMFQGHRDLVGATNIPAKLGGGPAWPRATPTRILAGMGVARRTHPPLLCLARIKQRRPTRANAT
ncbi:MAG TPA: zinc ribbon domain-containing protein [Actinomycetota bacterium]